MDEQAEFNIMAESEFSSLSAPMHDEVDFFTVDNGVQEKVAVRTERLETTLHRLKEEFHFERPFVKLDTQGFDYAIVNGNQLATRQFLGLQSELAVKKRYADSIDFRESLALY